MRTSHLQKGLPPRPLRELLRLCNLVDHVAMPQPLRLLIVTVSRWCLPADDTTADNALHPAERRLIPRADTERRSFALNAPLYIAQLTSRARPPWCL